VAVRERPRITAGIAAVVLNYRAADDTLLAVQSLRASRRRPNDIIVVDNDEHGTAQAALSSLAPHIVYMHAPVNLGYSGGMNLGIREALRRGADRVLLVNSDVVLPPDCLERLEEALDSAPSVGIAGPVVVARSDPDRFATLGMSYRPASGRMRHVGFGRRVDGRLLAATAPVDGVAGCVMLVRRDVFDAVGLFDDDYFFSFEDLDFCLRARRAGFSTVLAGLATAHHEGGRSIGARSPRRLYFGARGHLLLARRAGPPTSRLCSAMRTTSIVMLNLAHAVRSSGAPLPTRLGAVARGVRDYFVGRFGPDRDASAL
jgi:GT2 family glycosyltransferase